MFLGHGPHSRDNLLILVCFKQVWHLSRVEHVVDVFQKLLHHNLGQYGYSKIQGKNSMVQKYPRVCISIQGYSEVSSGIQKYPRVYRSIQGYTKVSSGIQKYPRGYLGVSEEEHRLLALHPGHLVELLQVFVERLVVVSTGQFNLEALAAIYVGGQSCQALLASPAHPH